jgi:hypothetical protein
MTNPAVAAHGKLCDKQCPELVVPNERRRTDRGHGWQTNHFAQAFAIATSLPRPLRELRHQCQALMFNPQV